MRLATVYRLTLAGCLVAQCSCARSDSEEVASLKKELQAAKAAQTKAEEDLEKFKAQTPLGNETADERQSRALAEVFLEAVVTRKFAVAIDLTSLAYQNRYRQKQDGDDAAGARLEQRVYGSVFSEPPGPGWEVVRFTKWSVDSHKQMGGDEASFKGDLSGPARKAAYLMRVVKISGKWRVDSFEVPGPQK
jgi:hypothetical protein